MKHYVLLTIACSFCVYAAEDNKLRGALSLQRLTADVAYGSREDYSILPPLLQRQVLRREREHTVRMDRFNILPAREQEQMLKNGDFFVEADRARVDRCDIIGRLQKVWVDDAQCSSRRDRNSLGVFAGLGATVILSSVGGWDIFCKTYYSGDAQTQCFMVGLLPIILIGGVSVIWLTFTLENAINKYVAHPRRWRGRQRRGSGSSV